MRLLITGAQGQVGQALISQAQQQKIHYLACAKEELDISSEDGVINILKYYQPTVMINTAAYTDVEQAEVFPEPAYKINADAVGILARVCRAQNIPLLHISTDYVFSGTARTPYTELADTQPLNVYGASKLAGEQLLLKTWHKSIVMRTSWVFSDTGKNFVKTMWRLFHERNEVRIVNDQWGNPTSAQAIAQALLTMAFRVVDPTFHDWGIYHYAGEPAVSWYEFACAIFRMCQVKSLTLLPITSADFSTKAIRPLYSVLDMHKIKKIFNVSPCDWQKDLSMVIQHLEKRN